MQKKNLRYVEEQQRVQLKTRVNNFAESIPSFLVIS
jgi:hypothetical protein